MLLSYLIPIIYAMIIMPFGHFIFDSGCGDMPIVVDVTTPVETMIQAFGGVGKAARALDLEKTMISRWRWCGGIPTKRMKRVLVVAWNLGINLTPYDIIFGKEDK